MDMEPGQSTWVAVREVVQAAAAVIVIPLAIVALVSRSMISKVWPATFFYVGKARATKINSNPPKLEIRIPVRLHFRIAPGVDSLYVKPFGQDESPDGVGIISRYTEGFSFQMPRGKTPMFDLRVEPTLDRETIEAWNGGQAEIVMEHGWRKGRRAIRKSVDVELTSQ
jgi:hypothetical protein